MIWRSAWGVDSFAGSLSYDLYNLYTQSRRHPNLSYAKEYLDLSNRSQGLHTRNHIPPTCEIFRVVIHRGKKQLPVHNNKGSLPTNQLVFLKSVRSLGFSMSSILLVNGVNVSSINLSQKILVKCEHQKNLETTPSWIISTHKTPQLNSKKKCCNLQDPGSYFERLSFFKGIQPTSTNPPMGSNRLGLTGKVGIKEVTFSSLDFCGDKKADLGWRGLDVCAVVVALV